MEIDPQDARSAERQKAYQPPPRPVTLYFHESGEEDLFEAVFGFKF